ncbi:hypothetical protein [Streptosporangium canum]|uniref:hypothetical protein n=1 Tax=Streptosporangium canum TaxID=324952 RepID=UPI0034179ACF
MAQASIGQELTNAPDSLGSAYFKDFHVERGVSGESCPDLTGAVAVGDHDHIGRRIAGRPVDSQVSEADVSDDISGVSLSIARTRT